MGIPESDTDLELYPEPERIRRGGRLYYRWADGRLLPAVRGGAGNDDDGDDDDDDSNDDDADDDDDAEDEDEDDDEDEKDVEVVGSSGKKHKADSGDGKLFSQDAVNHIMAGEKREGRRSGVGRVLRSLGVSNEQEAKRLIDAGRKSSKPPKKEPKDDDRNPDNDDEVRTAREEAARDRFEARVERALTKAGMDTDDEGRVRRAIRMTELDPSANKDDIDSEVDALKDEMPHWFESRTPKKKSRNRTTTNGGRSNSGPPGNNSGGAHRTKNDKRSANDQAGDILAQRHPKTKQAQS